jgi:CHAT domain-containing protein
MIQYYRVIKKHGLRVALRKAQIAIRDSYTHPYYWAAFQLTGNVE